MNSRKSFLIDCSHVEKDEGFIHNLVSIEKSVRLFAVCALIISIVLAHRYLVAVDSLNYTCEMSWKRGLDQQVK